MAKVRGSLKFSRLRIMGFPAGYATASVEGRIAVEYFDPSPATQAKKYAFKCHRHTVEDVDQVYPVNALAFHPVYYFSCLDFYRLTVPSIVTTHLLPPVLTQQFRYGITR
jgi:hypothetical protein